MKRDWLKYLLFEWFIPLGLGAVVLGVVYGFLDMIIRLSGG